MERYQGSKDVVIAQTEDRIVEQYQKMLGYVPIGTRDLLHILVHPDMIELTKIYVDRTHNELSNTYL